MCFSRNMREGNQLLRLLITMNYTKGRASFCTTGNKKFLVESLFHGEFLGKEKKGVAIITVGETLLI